jgi:sporulation protein YlmC with PRC-barrel domain
MHILKRVSLSVWKGERRMRKVSVFLTTLILAALLLAACGGEETATLEPGTEVPPVTAEVIATDELVGETETVEPDDMTTTPVVPVTGEESPSRLTNLIDLDVWNQDGDQIGDVEDMVLDMDNTTIPYVIVGTGGFLELGEKEVFVPWNMLELQSAADNPNLGDQYALVYTGEQDLYDNAPDVDIDNVLPELGTPADDWDADIRNFWESGVVPEEGTLTETETPAGEATAVPDMTATVEGTDLRGVMLASDVLGATVQVHGADEAVEPDVVATADPNATATLGPDPGIVPDTAEPMDATIEDVIVDPESGEVEYLVISGDFADGERWIPVPLDFVQWDATNQIFLLRVNTTELQNAPVFTNGEFPDFTTDEWRTDIDAFWDDPTLVDDMP